MKGSKMDAPLILNVMIPCRERTNLTLKTIESIHKFNKRFSKIKIYCFDNLSVVSDERMLMFKRLLDSGKISYYSYDTSDSLYNCFGKVICFQRWVGMMKKELEILDIVKRAPLSKKNPVSPNPEYFKEKHYYMLVDNDMIFCPDWDEYFISAAEQCKESIHFIVKWPGGCPGASQRLIDRTTVKNLFSDKGETFQLANDYIGGASGMWFMTRKMLLRHEWENIDIASTYGKFKKHDSKTWEIINRRNRGHRINYVARVIHPNPKEKPLLLHLGGIVGSMCNSLTKNQFDQNIETFQTNDSDIGLNSIEELIERFKDRGAEW